MSSKSVHLCFCSLCKGKTLQSGYKIKKHAKLYGVLSTAKKLRLEESNSSATSASDDEKNEYVEEDASISPMDDLNDQDDVVYDQNKSVPVKVKSWYKNTFSSPKKVTTGFVEYPG